MKQAAVYLSNQEKATICDLIRKKGVASSTYLRNALVNALPFNQDIQYGYRPCSGESSITANLDDEEFDNLVRNPAFNLKLTNHTYISSILFNQLYSDFEFAVSGYHFKKSSKASSGYMSIPIDNEHHQILKFCKQYGVIDSYRAWLVGQLDKYKDVPCIMSGCISTLDSRLSFSLRKDDVELFNKIKNKHNLNQSQLLGIFIDDMRPQLVQVMSSWETVIAKQCTNTVDDSVNDNSCSTCVDNYAVDDDLANAKAVDDDINKVTTNVVPALNVDDLTSINSANPDEVPTMLSTQFYGNLVTNISVYDTDNHCHISRDFRNVKTAEYVFSRVQAGNFDFVKCVDDEASKNYADIQVHFSTLNSKDRPDFSDKLLDNNQLLSLSKNKN